METKDCTCAVVPAYNCSSSIEEIVRKTRNHLPLVFVVDDASEDGTGEWARRAGAKVLRYERNRGKGAALRAGFREALREGMEYAVTLDGDGQHDPSDIPLFLQAIRRFPGAMILGKRDMGNSNAPRTSRIGNRIANFFVNRSARLHLPDTQCGFRLYPLRAIDRMILRGNGYEFESEVIVRASRMGIPFHTIPISVHYPQGDSRSTHFHLWRDTIRIFGCVLRSYFWR